MLALSWVVAALAGVGCVVGTLVDTCTDTEGESRDSLGHSCAFYDERALEEAAFWATRTSDPSGGGAGAGPGPAAGVPLECGSWDSEDGSFRATINCCACGGGNVRAVAVVVVLTEDRVELRRWAVCGLPVAVGVLLLLACCAWRGRRQEAELATPLVAAEAKFAGACALKHTDAVCSRGVSGMTLREDCTRMEAGTQPGDGDGGGADDGGGAGTTTKGMAWMGWLPLTRAHKPQRVGRVETRRFDLVVIGAGSAGLTAAKFAARFGKSVVLIEKGRYGGDCTWTGCVPSKSLLHHTTHAQIVSNHRKKTNTITITNNTNTSSTDATNTDINNNNNNDNISSSNIDMTEIRSKIESTIQRIYTKDDSPESLNDLNIDTITGSAQFLNSRSLQVTLPASDTATSEEEEEEGIEGEAEAEAASRVVRVVARQGVVIATGAGPRIPRWLRGVGQVRYVTYEQFFDLPSLPPNVTVVGGGPVGCELAQAMQRLGVSVTVVGPRLLPQADPAASAALAQVFERDGIRVVTGRVKTVVVHGDQGGHKIRASLDHTGEKTATVLGQLLVVAVGRAPVTAGLDLERAGVEVDPDTGGIVVNNQLKTTARHGHVYAAGDCTGAPQFTHYAGFQGAIAARNILLPLSDPGVSSLPPPSCTFTSPQVAQCGITEADAVAKWGRAAVAVAVRKMDEVDRAVCDEQDGAGFIKIVYLPNKGGRIVGGTVVAPCAGEMASELSVAMKGGVTLPQLAVVMHAYPTYSIAIQQMAAEVYYDGLAKNARLYGVLKRLGL